MVGLDRRRALVYGLRGYVPGVQYSGFEYMSVESAQALTDNNAAERTLKAARSGAKELSCVVELSYVVFYKKIKYLHNLD